MRFAVPALALLLGACFDDTRTIEVDVDEVRLPMGAGAEIGVWVDGHELGRLDAFSWVVDRPELVSIAFTSDHAHVRVIGRAEGHTMLHLGYRTTVIDVPATILAPAVVGLSVEPSIVAAPVGTMVPVRALATYTTGDTRDVSATAVWVIDDPSIATVDQAGVRGMAAGSTTLHAIVDGTQQTTTVTIAP
ncbi:MAG: Ig-like domain-containing protein [Myxococcales bacterium]|nr:Ig-like domain-containing protein [Myxococcales bacterium]